MSISSAIHCLSASAFSAHPPVEPSKPQKKVTGNISNLTVCLNSMRRGNRHASEELLPLVYEDLRRHAVFGMTHERAQHTLQPTALVHEAWLRLSRSDGQRWDSRAHFFCAATMAMRRILIESARRKARLKRGANPVCVDACEVDVPSPTPEENVLLVDEALERLRLHDSEKARIVELKFFGGCTNLEVAETLGMSERSVERQWAYAKAWLFQSIRSAS